MIQRDRLVNDFEAMSQFTAPGEGINRLAFTDADWAGRQYIIDRMVDAGLTVETDGFWGMSLAIRLVRILTCLLLWLVLIRTVWPNGGNYDGRSRRVIRH